MSASVKSSSAGSDYQSHLGVITCFPVLTARLRWLRGPRGRVPVGVHRQGLRICRPTLGCLPGTVLILLRVLVVICTCVRIHLSAERMRTIRRNNSHWSLSTSLLRCGLSLAFLRLCRKAVRSTVFVQA